MAESLGRIRGRPELVSITRRGPLLRRSPRADQTFGLDLTAGCGVGCPFCYIRGSSRFPGPDRLLFDPGAADRLAATLDTLEEPPALVVLSPNSDPLPPFRLVRAAAQSIVDLLLARGIKTLLMTRGRLSTSWIDLLSHHPHLARVAVPLTTADRALARVLEPNAATPEARLRGIARLIAAGVEVDVRLEPMVPDLTDTPGNLRPLFAALAGAGVRDVTTHALFLQPALIEPLETALAPLGWSERLADRFAGGPVFTIGSLGPTKHLPLDARRTLLARLASSAAEFGLTVTTGASQNPDLRRDAPPTVTTGASSPRRRERPPVPVELGAG